MISMYHDNTTTDEERMRSFQAGRLTPEAFRHHDHVRMAWAYLRKWPQPEALSRFTADLRRLACAHGKPNLYHATVTAAYVAIIAERMDRGGETEWDAFAAANPDLLRWRDGVLFDYYDPSILESETARRIFVLPKPAR